MSNVTTVTAVQKCFHRELSGLRAAHLNQRVVVTGGMDDGFNIRDEVLCGILYLIVLTLFSFQVLEYNGSTWSEKKEKMTMGHRSHAIIEVNLPALCPTRGNLNQHTEKRHN